MRTIIIPDVHENIDPVKEILFQESPDHVVYLGDWFDRFPSQPGNLADTVYFLRSEIISPDTTFLYGNHDMPYAFEVDGLSCSGHQHRESAIYDFFLSKEAKAKFKLYTEVEGWLLSHAGFSRYLVDGNKGIREEICLNELFAGRMHYMVAAGEARGGRERVGGVTWLDWDQEFRRFGSEVKQIVGHTTHKEPQFWKGSWCLDTRLKHYGVIEDGKLTINNIDGTEWEQMR